MKKHMPPSNRLPKNMAKYGYCAWTGFFLLMAFCGPTMNYAQMEAVPAGTFEMGAENGEPNESPRHTVALSRYAIDKYEVTKAQYDSCVTSGACSPAHYDDGACVAWTGRDFKNVRVPQNLRNARYPVVCVTWFQAQEYCRSVGKKLPSEAQWEYSALASRDVDYAWGNERPDAAHCTQPSENKPKPVGSFDPNPWGLYDMTGNVWEWASDRYQPDYYSTSEPADPQGPDAGQYRVIRGGGWYSTAQQLRIRNRHWFEPNFGEVSVGFRCAK
jgi:formylglycine-generating enzyme required for sulfatase activity